MDRIGQWRGDQEPRWAARQAGAGWPGGQVTDPKGASRGAHSSFPGLEKWAPPGPDPGQAQIPFAPDYNFSTYIHS